MEYAAPDQISRFPELSFYYGLSLDELITMPRAFLKLYIIKLPSLLAQQQLSALEAGLAQGYKEHDLERRIDELKEIIEEQRPEPPKQELTREMMEMKMAGLGIGVTWAGEDNG